MFRVSTHFVCLQLLGRVMCSMESVSICASMTFSIKRSANVYVDMFWRPMEYPVAVSSTSTCYCIIAMINHRFMLMHLEYHPTSLGHACQLPCTHLCTRRGPAHHCRCYPGYQLAEDGVTCEGNTNLRLPIHIDVLGHSEFLVCQGLIW